MSVSPTAIAFFHCGKIPRYLYAAMESARVFNPGSPIFLITDRGSDVPSLGVKAVSLQDTAHHDLPQFRGIYRHIAFTAEDYERRCFERWFHIEQLIKDRNLSRIAYLDSDCLIFADVDELFRCMPEKTMCASRDGGPACTLIRGTLQPFLDLILEKFSDDNYLLGKEQLRQQARGAGAMANLTDMDLVALFTTTHQGGHVYHNNLPTGHIDHCLNVPDAMEFLDIAHRNRRRKKIFWAQEKDRLLPYFRDAETGNRVPALAIHFQSGAKRLIRRFNRVDGRCLLPLPLRLNFFRWLHAGWGSQYL
ncbi:MAG: hypothetical protein FGM15_05955 [Chthoniobacterales bacterium]|nr:hypothetical protein [Chthoniobacterales bacterium]